MVWIPFGVHIEAQVFDSHHRAVDVSLKFPHSEVIGLDIVPPVLRDGNLPSNCRFEIDDCNLSFTHWVNTFDFVHARSVDTAIHDFPTFLYNMAQIMRPGAVLIVGSGLPHFFDENRQPHPDVEEGEEGFSWLQKAFTATLTHYLSTIPTPNRPDCGINSMKWGHWAEDNPNFEEVATWEIYLPIGNWKPGSLPPS
ncbi:hypothetical protein FRC03_000171 [Tulasnella sp. 419]|nr:hypothetical protein FRC03_000171 [Tulasnella sp. 419]